MTCSEVYRYVVGGCVAGIIWVFVPVLCLVSVRVLQSCSVAPRTNHSHVFIAEVENAFDHGSGTAALLESMYWRVRMACFAWRKMVDKLGLCLDTNGKRSFILPRELRM